HLVVRYANADTCVLEILGAPPPPARPSDRPVPLGAARLTTSWGPDPHALVDRDLATHWVVPVRRSVADYVQIDLQNPRRLTRLVVRLGPHFGEYLRSLQVEASADGQEWTTIVDRPIGEAPLLGLVRDPEDLRVEIALPPTTTAHLRLVRPAGPDPRHLGARVGPARARHASPPPLRRQHLLSGAFDARLLGAHARQRAPLRAGLPRDREPRPRAPGDAPRELRPGGPRDGG